MSHVMQHMKNMRIPQFPHKYNQWSQLPLASLLLSIKAYKVLNQWAQTAVNESAHVIGV